MPIEQRSRRPDPPQVGHMAGNTALGQALGRTDRTAEAVQRAAGGPNELLRVDVQPFQNRRSLAGNEPTLVLADHPTGAIHPFQVVLERERYRGGQASGGIEGHQWGAR